MADMTNIRLELCNRIRMEAEHINDTDFPLEVFPQTMQSVILDMARYENYKAEFIATAMLSAGGGGEKVFGAGLVFLMIPAIKLNIACIVDSALEEYRNDYK